MNTVTDQIKDLDIPYPQRRLLELEVNADLQAHGAAASDARFSTQELADLRAIHATPIRRFLERFGQARKDVETSAAFLPLLVALFYIMEDRVMVDFIREGGVGMYAILAIGLLLLGKELLNVIRLVIIKDHSSNNLRIDTPSVLLGCLALALLSLVSTILGFYKSAEAATQTSTSYDILIIGAKESITSLVLGLFLCSLVILAHYGTRRALHVWHAPVT
jgi:hypothetical protein